jgi:hypothetical protein
MCAVVGGGNGGYLFPASEGTGIKRMTVRVKKSPELLFKLRFSL